MFRKYDVAMNLLVLSTWFPYPPDNGSRLRAFHLIRELAGRHRIRLVAGLQEDVAPQVGGEIPKTLRELCEEVVPVPWRWYAAGTAGGGGGGGGLRALLSLTPRSILETDNPRLRSVIDEQLGKPTDAVLVLQQGMAPFLPPAVTPPAVLDEVEVSGLDQAVAASRGRARLRHALTRWKAHRYWRSALRRFLAATAVSEAEAAAVRRMAGMGTGDPGVAVIPNGVDVRAYRREAGRTVPGRLLYNGALTYGPNLEAVRWFAADVLPLVAAQVPDAHLVVTGRSDNLAIDDLRADPRVRLTGFLPDLRPALDEAALCVVPLRSGGGTRLKILEAFAAELPVVSTSVGAAGLAARSGEHLLLADTPRDLADGVARLLQEPERARTLARRARHLVEERYDWSAISATLSDLLERCVAMERRNTA